MKRVFTLLGLLPALATAAPWLPSGSVDAIWNSNVTNASAGSDRIAALAITADAATTARYSVAAADALLPEGHIGVEWWPRFDLLSEISIGPAATWQHKFGLGRLAPVAFAKIGLDAIGSRDRQRNGYRADVTLGWRKRLTDETELTLTEDMSRREAREAVYDRDGAETTIEVDHSCSETLRFNLSAFWRQGDVLSHATPPRPDLVALAPNRVIVDTFGRRFVAYSIRAQTAGGRLLIGRTVSPASEVTLSYEYRNTERSDFRYVNHLVSVAWLHQF